MKISILLPYKENFSPEYAGAVSIFINDTIKKSLYKKNIIVYGNTNLKKFSNNYVNLNYEKLFLKSSTKSYIQEFLKNEKKNKSDLIELHNRPSYVKYLNEITYAKKVLYFHNDPLNMSGSRTINERINLLNTLDKIVFNSNWSKKRFIKNLEKIFQTSPKLLVIKQSIDPKKIKLNLKKKIIIFVGKLNRAKGYDLFGNAVLQILDKHKDWHSIVIGDEPREKIIFNHSRLKIIGFQKHETVMRYLEKSSIAVVCSRWEEPFGRTSLEAASRGCSVIISNRGGLKETITDGIVLKELSSIDIYKSIKKLIVNKNLRINYQKKSLKNFYLTNEYTSKKIDNYRNKLLGKKIEIKKNKTLKILHITNLNERHNGRLFYNTGRRINNGFIKLNHKVLTLSDRDLISNYRSINDLSGSRKLNKTILETVNSFQPELIVLGHADLVKKECLNEIQKNFPNIKIAQWFLDKMDGVWLNNKKRFLDKIDLMDASFCTTDPKILNFNKKFKVFYMPNPVDKSLDDLDVYKNKNPEYDLFFAMSHGVHRGVLKKGKFDDREHIVNNLIRENKNIKFNVFGMKNIQPIWGDEFKKNLYNSKIALNLSQGKPIKYYSSDRIAQLIGNGIATLVDKKTKLDNYFSKKEVIFYNSKKDLNNKIRTLLKNDKLRNEIAKNGKKKYFKYFNSTVVADFIINKAFGNNKKFFWENIK